MFGLLKLLAYGLLGYALYEFFRGMSGGQGMGMSMGMGQGQQGGGGGGGGGAQQFRSEGGSGAAITGPGIGQLAQTQDFDGGTTQHRVGRGVVSQ